MLGVMPKAQHTDVHVRTMSSNGHDANTHVNDVTANTDVKKPYVDRAKNEYNHFFGK